jgi:hypothetical protein
MQGELWLPVPTEAQRTRGRELYNRLGLCASSYQTWFAEGIPQEWLRALDAIQATLTAIKREARDAAKETPGAR